MIKATTTKQKVETKPAAPVPPIAPADLSAIASYFAIASDSARTRKGHEIENLRQNIENSQQYIVRKRGDIEDAENDIINYTDQIAHLESELSAMPPPKVITDEEIRADLSRLSALSYVKSVEVQSAPDNESRKYVVITTRENSLYTALDKKYSRSERWYKAKPYTIPLPAYKIRIALQTASTLSNNSGALAIALANHAQDTGQFLEWITHFMYEPHPHWATTSVPSSDPSQYRGACLGEYESEITSAARRSITDFVISFVIYLQNAGAAHAYISRREYWALWLGNSVYNALIVPSEKEVKTLTEATDDTDDDDGESPMCGDDNDTACSDCEHDECECECHL